MDALINDVVCELRQYGLWVPVFVPAPGQLLASCMGEQVYIPHWQTLRAKMPCTRAGMRHTLRHEVGHVYFKRHARVLRAAGFERVFGSLETTYPTVSECVVARLGLAGAHMPTHVSTYAQIHPEEDFAETFAYVLRKRLRPLRVGDAQLRRKVLFVIDAVRWRLDD